MANYEPQSGHEAQTQYASERAGRIRHDVFRIISVFLKARNPLILQHIGVSGKAKCPLLSRFIRLQDCADDAPRFERSMSIK
jgi:hypothetical protein